MADISALFRVQQIETRLNELDQTERELGRGANVSALEEMAKELRSRLASRSQQASENQKRQKELELECERCLEHRRQEETLLYSGKISNPRELEQIQQKMNEYRQLQERLETEILNLLENDEKLKAELDALEARLSTCLKELESRRKSIQEKKLELHLEREQLQTEREKLLP